jgi:glucosamine--fructose-6-phosphate aminotransferase (isomerizing)
VTGHGLDLDAPGVERLLSARVSDELYKSLAVRTPLGHLSFVYKVAAEIGGLGDNTRALRSAIRNDPLLHLALAGPEALVTVVGHTRWASVGVISEANAHPLNSEEAPAIGLAGRTNGSDHYVIGAVNGDVDNYRELSGGAELRVPAEISTDSKVVPTLVARRLAEGAALDDAFRSTVARFEGSAAIAASVAEAPEQLHLALHGSGQALYVGLAEDAFVVSSEIYGVVQETSRYLSLNGEGGAGRAPGQVVVLDRAGAGTVAGVRRTSYDGTPQPVDATEIRVAEVTTRDIDRAGFPHFLLKEISEAPESLRKTLRGKISEDPRTGLLRAHLGPATLPPEIVERLASGAITRITVIAQGTAAVAGQSVAATIAAALHALPIVVRASLATELSGFGLAGDMSDTLIVAVSQSGTTTDTNRTIDLVRNRGAAVIAIVNRRNSDLVDKSDGVLYTSDGRDVEMSVASTKAFYAQVAAGMLLALALADRLGCREGTRTDRLLASLRSLPEAMETVLTQRAAIAAAARGLAPYRRHWAVVGNGSNRIAAEEVRIKLSELCYHSIACDGTEDKKHIDLSSEPLVLVCAAGLTGANADDVAKEVAIFRAHKAAPIVVASAGETARFAPAMYTIEVPSVETELAFVLSTMVGHLFGYEAALAIDAHARPLREARAAIEGMADHAPAHWGDGVLKAMRPTLEAACAQFFAGLHDGAYNANLEAATAVRLASLLRYATGLLPLEGYELEFGEVGTPGAILGDLAQVLSVAVSELTRPVDAIKHQAKTVTVGISRSEETLLRVPLVASALAGGAPADALSYRALRTLAALDAAVEEVQGFTRYRLAGDASQGATIEVVDRGGTSLGLRSRTESDHRLLGAKRRAAQEREVIATVGARDGRSLILVPEVRGTAVTGMTLLHVQFRDVLAYHDARAVLSGYRGRYAALVDAVTETETTFVDEQLESIPMLELLTEPVQVLARHWSHALSGSGAGDEPSAT